MTFSIPQLRLKVSLKGVGKRFNKAVSRFGVGSAMKIGTMAKVEDTNTVLEQSQQNLINDSCDTLLASKQDSGVVCVLGKLLAPVS